MRVLSAQDVGIADHAGDIGKPFDSLHFDGTPKYLGFFYIGVVIVYLAHTQIKGECMTLTLDYTRNVTFATPPKRFVIKTQTDSKRLEQLRSDYIMRLVTDELLRSGVEYNERSAGRVPDCDDTDERVTRLRSYMLNPSPELISDLAEVLEVRAVMRYCAGVHCVVLSSAVGGEVTYAL